MRYGSFPIKEMFAVSLGTGAAILAVIFLRTHVGGFFESFFSYLFGAVIAADIFCTLLVIFPRIYNAEIDLSAKELKLWRVKGAIPFSDILGVKYPEDTLLLAGEKFMALMTSNGAVRVPLILVPESANKASVRISPKPAAEYGFLSDLKKSMQRAGFELQVEEVNDLREYLH